MFFVDVFIFNISYQFHFCSFYHLTFDSLFDFLFTDSLPDFLSFLSLKLIFIRGTFPDLTGLCCQPPLETLLLWPGPDWIPFILQSNFSLSLMFINITLFNTSTWEHWVTFVALPVLIYSCPNHSLSSHRYVLRNLISSSCIFSTTVCIIETPS